MAQQRGAPMVRLGRTGIVVNKNGFGALPVQRVDMDAATAILRRAYDAGVRFFDTARAYSDSEEKLGNALAGVRQDIFIATKTYAVDAKGFWQQLEASLRLLRTDYVDIYQFHNPALCPKPGDESGLYDAALEAKRQGKIRFIGFTNHRLPVAQEALESGLYDTLQFPFSYLASEQELALARRCAELEVGFIAMKGLCGGLLNDAPTCYNWMCGFENVLPIWGVQSLDELEQFLACGEGDGVLTPAQRARIEGDRAELQGEFCRSCGYCAPCPVGIEIHNAARMAQLLRRSPSAGWLSVEWQEKMRRIEDCLHCGQCAKKCPYGLDIPSLLQKNWQDYKTFL